MVAVGNEPHAACLLGACATNRNESAAVPTFTDAEKADAKSLARRLVTLARSMRGLVADAAPAAALARDGELAEAHPLTGGDGAKQRML